MSQTWQMDSPFDNRPRRPGFRNSLFTSWDSWFWSQTSANQVQSENEGIKVSGRRRHEQTRLKGRQGPHFL